MTTNTNATTRPRWDETWAHIGSEDMLAAKALIEISPALLAEASSWLGHEERPVYASDHWDAEQTGTRQGDPIFRWDEWLADVDDRGRGWSSTEARLFQVVACLLDSDRKMPLRFVLDSMGSWEADVWRILTEWGTGGNNRDCLGRSTAVRR